MSKTQMCQRQQLPLQEHKENIPGNLANYTGLRKLRAREDEPLLRGVRPPMENEGWFGE